MKLAPIPGTQTLTDGRGLMDAGWTRWLNALQDRAESMEAENAYADQVAAAAQAAAEAHADAGIAAADTALRGYTDSTVAAAIAALNAEAATEAAGSVDLSLSAARVWRITLSDDVTLTLSGAQAGRRYDLVLIQDGSGGHVVTWPAGVLWPGGSPPTLTGTAGSVDWITLVATGSGFLADSRLDLS